MTNPSREIRLAMICAGAVRCPGSIAEPAERGGRSPAATNNPAGNSTGAISLG